MQPAEVVLSPDEPFESYPPLADSIFSKGQALRGVLEGSWVVRSRVIRTLNKIISGRPVALAPSASEA